MRKSSSLQLIEAQALRKQQTAFCVLTLMVIAALLLLHTLFASLLGEPSNSVVLLLGASFAIKVIELVWLQGKAHGLSKRTARFETAFSILGSFLLTAVLAYLTDRDDSPYFVLLAVPILQSAYHFGWITTVLTIASAIGMNFFWIGHYFHLHPPARSTEFLETGMIAVIYTLMGLFVWFLVDELGQQQTRLYENLEELELARERLLVEEKLAAVGRLASGIAHEIRNPVAMISSSLATAANPAMNLAEREEMVQIAAKEAGRLERLTSDFLSYARPAKPQRSSILVSDLQLYVVDAVKAHAAAKGVEVVSSPADGLLVEVDSAQIQGALLNLALNGIEAAEASGELSFNAALSGSLVQINIADTGGPIPEADLPRIFEPFYSTKPSGTGLGLAIARRAAQNHGGDLWVSCNEAGRVVFSMTLPCQVAAEQAREL